MTHMIEVNLNDVDKLLDILLLFCEIGIQNSKNKEAIVILSR